jgi:hypothetical protein
MEAVRTSETSVDNHFTRQYNPEDSSEHHTRRRENLKSHIPFRWLWYDLKCLWSKDGFHRMVGERHTTYDTERLQSIRRTRKSPFYVCLIILPLIHCANCLFLGTWFVLFYKAGDASRYHCCAFWLSYDLYFLIKNLSILIITM